MSELETALLSISQKLETTPSTSESDKGAAEASQQPLLGASPSAAVISQDSNADNLLKHAPVLSLFDNAIFSRQPDDCTHDKLPSSRSPGSQANSSSIRIDQTCRTLLSFFPSEQRQEAILDASYTWWQSWLDIYPGLFNIEHSFDVSRFVADLKSSGSVQKITKALLCFFNIQQEVSHSLDTSYDMARAANQNGHALGIIDEMVLNDDGLAGTIDGVECFILRSKYELNCGRVRKAWLAFRRGISLAQLSGFHKRATNQVTDKSQSRRRDSLWKALYSGDRFLSLMLGLPYGPSEIHSDIGRDSEVYVRGVQAESTDESFFYRLSNIIGHIIDRNQQLPSNNMLALTFKIEGEMMELAASMSNDWWESGREHGDAVNRMWNQLVPQFCHHQARSLLHLPFMLKAMTDRRFEYNKIAAVESAREMIARYLVIRPAHGFGSLICKMTDFQVFGGAMILVLNLFDHYRKSGILDHSEADKDQDLITSTTDILRRASVETDGGVATQAARALELFGNIKGLSLPYAESEEHCTAKVVIPYFGTVVIGPGTSLKCETQRQESKATDQPRQLPTPSDQSINSNSESATPNNPLMDPTIPFDFNNGEISDDINVNGGFLADINFDLDQDWNWFWNNIEVPPADLQATVT